MPNQVTSNAYAVKRCPETNRIVDIQWLAGHICSAADARQHEPTDIVFLKESFGEGSAQVLSFEFMDDEFALYADSDSELRQEIYDYLSEQGKVTILAHAPKPGYATQYDTIEWTLPVTVYENYLSMVDALANLNSKAAATYNAM
ncbi:MAG: Uncharacterized protein AWU57_29 [Marinobacter sp. T13-3]|nr:MAG: Uncharacterized protein AWU57_29 [Marinobacter sp. T13-3]